jgi:hypothetical protein
LVTPSRRQQTPAGSAKPDPGPSYLDEGSGGPENDFTNRNTTFMAWNLMHLASMLTRQGGYPAEGNTREAWASGERFGFDENPEYR